MRTRHGTFILSELMRFNSPDSWSPFGKGRPPSLRLLRRGPSLGLGVLLGIARRKWLKQTILQLMPR